MSRSINLNVKMDRELTEADFASLEAMSYVLEEFGEMGFKIRYCEQFGYNPDDLVMSGVRQVLERRQRRTFGYWSERLFFGFIDFVFGKM